MIEIHIRLRSAVSNPASRGWRWGVSVVALALATLVPVATSRAQDHLIVLVDPSAAEREPSLAPLEELIARES